MDAEDRRLLSETHAQSVATARVLDEFLRWSREVHEKRDLEIKELRDDQGELETRVDRHDSYVAVFCWATGIITTTGIGAALLKFLRGG